MDYRHTEDFARRMEMAELRARALRRDASLAFWNGVSAVLGRWFTTLAHRLASARRHGALPEA